MAANKIAELKSAAEHLKKEIAKKKEEVYDCTFNECVSKSNGRFFFVIFLCLNLFLFNNSFNLPFDSA
jgi:hypothetical protein